MFVRLSYNTPSSQDIYYIPMAINSSNHQMISSFNPICCFRPLPRMRCATGDTSAVASASLSFSKTQAGEPASPVVGCTGRIKRVKAKHGGLAPAKGTPLLWKPLRARKRCPKASAKIGVDDVYSSDMDAPLPVVKRGDVAKDSSDVGSLWKKRRGEKGLQGLQLQQQKLQQAQHLCLYVAAA